jgi:hypothetical protein
MFRDQGFQDVGTYDAQVERWNGNVEKGVYFMLVRPATVKAE